MIYVIILSFIVALDSETKFVLVRMTSMSY